MDKRLTLATAWNPRGELSRFERLIPLLTEIYAHLVVTTPPQVETGLVERLHAFPQVHVFISQNWSWGRWLALEKALLYPSETIHYVDCDRLLRWVETLPQEWRKTTQALAGSDFTLNGRTEKAYKTHPQALLQTEKISNFVVSAILGKKVDVSAGSKGFSRQAVEAIIKNCRPGHALGADGEWTITLHRLGYGCNYLEVDGLDWESADRFQLAAADTDQQSLQAEQYDADPRNWSHRVDVAYEVAEWALAAANGCTVRHSEAV